MDDNINKINLSDTDKRVNTDIDFQSIRGAPVVLSEEIKKEISDGISNGIEGVKKSLLIEAKNGAKEEIIKQVQTDKASLITVFGIFASIISFLTIEFQFLRTVCSIEKLLGFTLILTSLLLCFNLALDYLVKSRTDIKTPKPNISFNVFIAILFLLGNYYISLGNEEVCKDNKIYEKYSENFEVRQTEFNQKYRDEQDKKYSEFENKIIEIEKKVKK